MIVTAAMVWWNERPEDLDRCVRGVSVVADRIVAVDGAYRRYPGATIRSPAEQARAIRKAAKETGMECRVIIPKRLWAGQVEKRAFLLAEASKGSDWICNLDADWIVSGEREAARTILEKTGHDMVAVDFRTPMNDERPLNESIAHTWHQGMVGTTVQLSQFFKTANLKNLTVERLHFNYSAERNGQRIWVWGPNGTINAEAMPPPYIVDHMSLFRTKEQILASRAFLNDRAMLVAQTQYEDDQPGYAPPIWDYETIPSS